MKTKKASKNGESERVNRKLAFTVIFDLDLPSKDLIVIGPCFRLYEVKFKMVLQTKKNILSVRI